MTTQANDDDPLPTVFPTYIPAPPGTPWRTDSELAMVRDWFYPERTIPDPYAPPEGDTRQDAIEKVRVYVFKDRKTPHALIATVYLTEALVHDQQPERKQHIGNVAMMSIYAMAFVKFVNGFVDRDVAKFMRGELAVVGAETGSEDDDEEDEEMESEHENERVAVKGGGESSMYAYAVKIGMPQGFVDLRHQIVHGQIPELWILRKKTKQALEWLWEKWWKVYAAGDPARALRARELRRVEKEEATMKRELKRRKVDSEMDSGDVTDGIS